jgi:hypothetical protein
MKAIEYRTTKARAPRTNRFVERMNWTLLDECFRVGGQSTWCESVQQLPAFPTAASTLQPHGAATRRRNAGSGFR